jgi:glycosyltransferase involved in cell wall biosynthesis
MTYVPTQDSQLAGQSDIMGWSKVVRTIDKYKPDAVHIVGDAAMVITWLIHEAVYELPGVAYLPIEGAPMNMQWVQGLLQKPDLHIITASRYGQRVLDSESIPSQWAYHGVSPDFKPLSPEARAEWRWKLDWEDKFVVMNVAQNVGRKQWPRLFEAIKIAERSVPNVMLYAHTVPFNNYWLDGHDLPQLAQQMGVWDRVIFPPDFTKHNSAVDLHSKDEYPGLVELYGMADMFVLPSQCEGFGLPLAEAMACGLPVATTDYAAQAEVVGKAGILLPVTDWTVNRSHTRYANVAPRDIADAIIRMAKSPEARARYRARSLERSKTFTWDDYRGLLKEWFGAHDSQTPAKVYEGVDKRLEASGGNTKAASAA